MKKDYRSETVKKLVVIGESNAFGMCAADPRNEWVQTVANLIRDFQDEPLSVLNNSIHANYSSPSLNLERGPLVAMQRSEGGELWIVQCWDDVKGESNEQFRLYQTRYQPSNDSSQAW